MGVALHEWISGVGRFETTTRLPRERRAHTEERRSPVRRGDSLKTMPSFVTVTWRRCYEF